jgi:hypothetical protein
LINYATPRTAGSEAMTREELNEYRKLRPTGVQIIKPPQPERPKAEVLALPLDEEIRRRIINGRPGRWAVVPWGLTAAQQDNGPSYAELETRARLDDGEHTDKHEEYSRSLYGGNR